MYLQFKAIKPILEASVIDLPDVDPIYAVKAADETVQLVPKAVFLRLFEEVPDTHGPVRLIKRARPRRAQKTAATQAPPAPPEPKVRKPSPVAVKCLQILNQHGALTTPELSGHMYPEVAQRFRVQNFSALSLDLRKKGWVEKKTEPSSGLDKWFLTAAGKEQLS